MNDINLYYLLSVDEIVAIKDVNIRNCKVKDMTIEELELLEPFLNARKWFTVKSCFSINTIIELSYRFDKREYEKKYKTTD